jgi:hypothetical protein
MEPEIRIRPNPISQQVRAARCLSEAAATSVRPSGRPGSRHRQRAPWPGRRLGCPELDSSHWQRQIRVRADSSQSGTAPSLRIDGPSEGRRLSSRPAGRKAVHCRVGGWAGGPEFQPPPGGSVGPPMSTATIKARRRRRRCRRRCRCRCAAAGVQLPRRGPRGRDSVRTGPAGRVGRPADGAGRRPQSRAGQLLARPPTMSLVHGAVRRPVRAVGNRTVEGSPFRGYPIAGSPFPSPTQPRTPTATAGSVRRLRRGPVGLRNWPAVRGQVERSDDVGACAAARRRAPPLAADSRRTDSFLCHFSQL